MNTINELHKLVDSFIIDLLITLDNSEYEPEIIEEPEITPEIIYEPEIIDEGPMTEK